MKANELMIGDWVNTHKGNYQIDCIQDNDVVGTTYNNGEGVESLFRINKIEPIPLTPEILENNGFNVNKYSDGEYYADIMFEDQGRRVEIDYRYGVDIDVCVIGRNNTPPFSRIETQVRYIHELQHIFRVVQINKEIVF